MLDVKSCMILLSLVAGSFLPAVALRARSSQVSKVSNLESYTFQQFVKDFQRDYQQGTDQWTMREELFNKRIAEMVEFNAQPAQTWNMGLSKFMDYTEAEKKGVLGYTGRGSHSRVVSPAATSLQRARQRPNSFSVKGALSEKKRSSQLVGIVRDQGNCGSCWAEAATATLEGQMEVNATLMDQLAALQNVSKVPAMPTLASQAVVSCTPNPRNCGGQGGCSGATVELAYGMLEERGGLPFAVEWNYMGRDMPCKEGIFSSPKIGITGFTVLPSNKQEPLLEALVMTGGPIAISVDASNWFMYGKGIYSDAKTGDFTVNHAVTLMGYTMPEGDSVGWYDIKNSWGSYWGESGHIRIEMKPDEEKHCGWDYRTHDGLACDGDPDTAWVCGTCGILYDSVFPTGIHFKHAA